MRVPTQDLKDALATLFRSRYAVAAMIFLAWITIFDEDNLITKWAYDRKIKELRAEKAALENSIEQDQRKMNELKNNRESLEKFAREEYFMKKDDETIFIIKR